MTSAAVDIGTNTVRLLAVDDAGNDLLRTAVITGLGRGVDAARRFHPDAVEATLAALGEYREMLDRLGVENVRAVATSATRDARDGPAFLDAAFDVLRVRPEVISGDAEARLAFAGGTATLDVGLPALVVDIGGGSTEFVYGTDTPSYIISIDIGSVRLTERTIPDRPASQEQITAARVEADEALAAAELPGAIGTGIGVGGTWTTLVTMAREWPDGTPVHGEELSTADVESLIDRLAELTIEQTARLEGLHPARAPVILGGAIVAERAMAIAGLDSVTTSMTDILDGIVATIQ